MKKVVILLLCISTLFAAFGFSAFASESKTAYRVEKVYLKSGIKYIDIITLDGKTSSSVVYENVSVALSKGDIFVGSYAGSVLNAEKVSPISSYITEIDSEKGIVYLDGAGNVIYQGVTVNGVQHYDITVDNIGEKQTRNFYIYDGQLIYSDPPADVREYSFAVLKDLVNIDNDNYVAVLFANGVEKELLLSSDKAAIIDDVTYTASQFAEMYESGSKYLLVADYVENLYRYTLTLSKNYKEDYYTVLPKGTWISYSKSTQMFTIDGLGQAFLNSDSTVYCRYYNEKAYEYIEKITQGDLGESFDYATVTDTYLKYDSYFGVYDILGALIEMEIPLSAYKDTYLADGRLVVYAPEDSVTVTSSNTKYNKYSFLDCTTLNKTQFTYTEVPYDENTNSGAKAGALYVKLPYEKKYVELNSTMTQGLDTVVYGTLNTVSSIRNLISLGYDYYSLSSDAIIWGLSTPGQYNAYKQFTLSELAEMMDLVDDYNSENGTKHKIKAILLSYLDSDGYTSVSTVIVEVYKKDNNGVLASVNNSIFSRFLSSEEDTKTAIFSVDDTQGYVGQDITLPLTLKTNAEVSEITSWGIKYDADALEFIGFSNYDSILAKVDSTSYFDSSNGSFFLKLSSPTNFNSTICTLNFKIKDTAKAGESAILMQASAKDFISWSLPAIVEIEREEITVPATNFYFSSEEAKTGEEVLVTLSVEGEAEINSIALWDFEYDKDVLEFVGFEDYEEIEKACVIPASFDSDNMAIVLGLKDGAYNTDICKLRFRVKDTPARSSSTVTAKAIVKNDANLLDSVVFEGNITLEPVFVKGTSLVLSGMIGIKTYYSVDMGRIDDITAYTAIVDSDFDYTYSFKPTKLFYDSDKDAYYTVTYIPPKDMDNYTVFSRIDYTNSNGEEVNVRFSNSATQYIQAFKELADQSPDSEYGKALGLVEAMETYSACAESYFNKTEFSGEVDIDSDAFDTVEDPYVMGVIDGVVHDSTALVLEGGITIRHYFKLSGDISKYSFAVNDTILEAKSKGNLTYVDISDICASDADVIQELCIVDTTNGNSSEMTVGFSVLNYVKMAIGPNDEGLTRLAKALYNYYKQVESYLAK